jgi:Zn-finger nucleic acid-binding protein
MKCPVDGARLTIVEIRSNLVDYCPECRGIWMKREKLEKMLETVGSTEKSKSAQSEPEEKPKTIVDDFLEGFGLK